MLSRYARLERATAELQAPFALVDLDALRRQRARHRTARRRQADPPGEQVAALPRAAGAGAGARGLSRHARLHAARGAVAGRARARGPARRLPDRRRARRCASWPSARAAASAASASRGDGRQRRAARPDRARASARSRRRARARVPGRRRRLARARRPRARRRQALAGAHARAGRRSWRARSLASEGVQLVGLMMYEAQIAGRRRRPRRARRCGRGRSGRCRRAPRASWPARARRSRRGRSVLLAAGEPPLELVNGGGTGQPRAHRARARRDRGAAGSGLYAPALFDAYRAFAPTARGAVRAASRAPPRPGRRHGARRRLPRLGPGRRRAPAAPIPARGPAARPRRRARARCRRRCSGEAADALAIGDRVTCATPRPASCASASRRCICSKASGSSSELPTYRGEGECFL